MAYLAEIQLAVKGAKQLKDLSNTIEATSKKVDRLARDIQTLSEGGIPRTINNLRSIVRQAADAFDAVALNTKEASDAARDYYQANKTLNNALRERVKLLNDIQTAERGTVLANIKASQAARTASNFGLFSAGIESTAAVQKSIRRNKQKTARLPKAAIETTPLMLPAFQERGLQLLDDAVKLNTSQLNLERALNGERARGARYLEKQTAEEARQVQLGILGQRTNRLPGTGAGASGQFPVSGPMNLGGGRGQTMLPGSQAAARGALGAGLKGRLPGAISGGIIGGVFPLLFGQGGGAAAGGLAGGLIGGLMGPGGSFAGSLLGTLLGDIASQGQKIKQLGTDIGFSAQQANVLADGFKKANTDIEKFTGVVQNVRGLGLELEDQAELIKLTTNLTEKYGGQFDKVGNAITSALESGKVSQGTLNQLTSQGINIQQALADKFGVSRDRLLEMAKKGEIGIQDLINALVDMGNKGAEATKQPATGMEKLRQAATNLGNGIATLAGIIYQKLKPVLDWLAGTLAGILDLATNVVNAIAKALSGGSAVEVKARAAAQKRLIEARPELKNTLKARGGAFGKGGTSLTAAGETNLSAADKQLLETYYQAELKGITKPAPIKPIDVRGLGQAAPSGGGAGNNKAEKAAAREAARVAELVREQQLITLEYQKQQDIGAKIFAAEIARDPMLVRRLQGEQQLAEWGVKTANLLEKESSTAGKLAIAKAQQAEQAVIRQKIEQDMAKIEQERKDKYDDIILDLDLELKLRTATTEEARRQLKIENEIAKLKKAGFTPAQLADIENKKQKATAPLTPKEKLDQRVGQLKDELKDLTNPINQVIAGAKAIGNAFRDAFTGLVSGAMTGQEALAAFFKGVGDHFMDMAAQMIAKLIEIWLLETAVGFISGSVGGGLEGAIQAAGKLNPSVGFGAGTIPKFADGGMVTRPTLSVVGEGGQPEYIIPASKMRGAMNRYAAGARGSAVIPAGDGGDGGTTTMVAAPGAIDVRYTVERINSVDYVTADQFQQGMRQAAQQGAAQGEQRTLRRLQNSTGIRRRIGI